MSKKRRRLRRYSEEARETEFPMGHSWTITFQTQKPSRIKQSISVSLTSQFSARRGEKRKLAGEKLYFGGLFISIECDIRRCVPIEAMLAPYRDSPFNIVACNPNLAWRLKNSALNSDVAPLFPSSSSFFSPDWESRVPMQSQIGTT